MCQSRAQHCSQLPTLTQCTLGRARRRCCAGPPPTPPSQQQPQQLDDACVRDFDAQSRFNLPTPGACGAARGPCKHWVARVTNERTLHLVDKTRSDLEKAQSKAGAPMVKWKEATITLARFHQLALTLIQKVDYVKHAGQEPPSSAELDRVRNLDDICLWKPTDNVEKNT